ncbi:hypothetical protein O3P69_005366 [Scylla paramamosain]|uniref:Uncharacterized protein n=1 Tax=Scylla paramamosain TaxID=85552 RepID=A0AAW0U873_SCYPA
MFDPFIEASRRIVRKTDWQDTSQTPDNTPERRHQEATTAVRTPVARYPKMYKTKERRRKKKKKKLKKKKKKKKAEEASKYPLLTLSLALIGRWNWH